MTPRCGAASCRAGVQTWPCIHGLQTPCGLAATQRVHAVKAALKHGTCRVSKDNDVHASFYFKMIMCSGAASLTNNLSSSYTLLI